MTTTQVQGRPDIAYQPDFENFLARTATLYGVNKPLGKIPAGFPEELKSPLVWDNLTYDSEAEWTYELDENERLEISKSLIYFRCENLPSSP